MLGKVKSTRRRFLSLLGAAPVAGSLAAKAALDGQAAELGGLRISGLGAGISPPMGDPCADPSANRTPTTAEKIAALNNPAGLEAIRDLVWREQRNVYALDPDLAVMRSFSLNAKIAFQRQRNVERQIENLRSEYLWTEINKTIFKHLPGLGPVLGVLQNR